MDPLADAMLDADVAAREAVEALAQLRDALQRCYDAAGARGMPLAYDLGPLVTRAERMGLDVVRVLRVVAPHAELVRAEAECVG